MASIVPTTSTILTFTNFNPIKLTQDNYPIWLPQIVPHLKGCNMFGYVDDTIPCPPPTISITKDGVDSIEPNPAFLHWNMQHQVILGAITSALSVKMISHITRCTTSKHGWTTLETLFKSQSKAHLLQVRLKLSILKQENLSIADYYTNFQTLSDSFAAVNQPLIDVEQQAFLLGGLGSEYNPFIISVTTRVKPLSIEEIYGHLLAHELRLE
jgi:hypothetical protein